ncbi:MAG: RNA polymerase sigma-70 factor [Chitinophagaceae bacterium]|nr:RNA polymerase sigma-70 factor [Chitinophagaceae bacterium]
MQKLDDDTLVKLLQRGNDAAFTEIYHRYWNRLFSVAANKLNYDLKLAEELVQDIFLDLWHRREILDIRVSLSLYLAAAMKYKVIDARLKKKRIAAYTENLAAQATIGDTSTEKQISFDELQHELSALVSSLPEKCQLVYKLSREAGYSQKEIAHHLSISEKTVESHLARAVKTLRLGLKNFLTHIF